MRRSSYTFGVVAAAAAFAVVGTGCRGTSTAADTAGATATVTRTAEQSSTPSVTHVAASTTPPAAPNTTPAPPSATTTPAPSSAKPASVCASASLGQDQQEMAAARDALQPHVHAGEHACVVGLPGGFEAVLFDNSGHLRFWSSVDETHWKQDRTAAYRYDARDAKGQQLTVRGTVLTGMKNATFILNGTFTGDGTGNAMGYTYGRHGWGPIVWDGKPDQRVWGHLVVAAALPPADSEIQVSNYKMAFQQGDLVTYNCDASHQGGADCGAHLIDSHWRWDTTTKTFRADE